MTLSRDQVWTHARSRFLLPLWLCMGIVGCASSPVGLNYEPAKVASRLGFAGCAVSVPLSQSEVAENSRRSGNPDPESNKEWVAIAAAVRPGDQLRLVNCLGSKSIGDQYYYALFRADDVVAKFHPMIFN
jgi:hypothetical protein